MMMESADSIISTLNVKQDDDDLQGEELSDAIEHQLITGSGSEQNELTMITKTRKETPVKLQNDVDLESEKEEEEAVTSESDGTEPTKTPRRKSARCKVITTELNSNNEEYHEPKDSRSESDDQKLEGTKKTKQTRKTKKNGSRRPSTRSNESRVVFRCEHCVYSTVDKRSFVKHRSKHDPSIEVQHYKCQVCSKSFRSHQGYKFHMITHGDPDLQLKCSHCNFNTPQKWSLHQHLAVIHKVDERGHPLAEDKKCPHCDFACVVDKQLKLHILRKHTLDKPFKCEQCDYATVVKTDLQKHVSVTHKKERQYLCDVCGFRSQTHGGLERHKRAHLGLKPFKCEKCGMEYADLAKFKSHRQRHYNDEKPFVCHVCGHAFRRRDNLQVHLRKIHGTNLEGDVTRYSASTSKVGIREDVNVTATCSESICTNSVLTLTDMSASCSQLMLSDTQFIQSFSCTD